MIELIIVIVILGILAAIAIVSFGSLTNRSKLAADEQSVQAVARATAALVAIEQQTIDPADVATTISDCGGCTLLAGGNGVLAAAGDPWLVVGHDPDGPGGNPAHFDPGRPEGDMAATYGYITGAGWGTNEVDIVMASRVEGSYVHATILGYGEVTSWTNEDPRPSTEDTPALPDTPPAGAESVPVDHVVADGWAPPGSDEVIIIDEHNTTVSLDSGAAAVGPSGGFGGISSMVSTSPGFPHRALVTDPAAGAVTMIRHSAAATATATTFATGIPDARAITVGPSPTVPGAPGQLVLWDLYVGSSASSGSVQRVNATTRAVTPVASNLGGTPSALAGYACYTPGSSTPTGGVCLYAAVGDEIWRIDTWNGNRSIWATLPAGFNITGLVTVPGPALLVSGAGGTVTLNVADAAGSTVSAGNAAGDAAGGLTWVGSNSASAYRGAWAATSTGLSQRSGGSGSAALAGATHTHYHGQPNWLYSTDNSAVYVTDLSTGESTKIWPTELAVPAGWPDPTATSLTGQMFGPYTTMPMMLMANISTAELTSTPTTIFGSHEWEARPLTNGTTYAIVTGTRNGNQVCLELQLRKQWPHNAADNVYFSGGQCISTARDNVLVAFNSTNGGYGAIATYLDDGAGGAAYASAWSTGPGSGSWFSTQADFTSTPLSSVVRNVDQAWIWRQSLPSEAQVQAFMAAYDNE